MTTMTGGKILLGRTTGRVNLRVEIRVVVVCVVMLLLTAVTALVALTSGDYPLSAASALDAAVGRGDAFDVLVVQQWRAPRILMAVLLGGALGVGGAIFQSLTRNPLGSPDIIGFGTGAYTGALLVMLIVGGGYLATAAGALLGGSATAVAVYFLAATRGQSGHTVQGFRLIVIGIGVSAMLSSVNTWLVLQADVEDAMRVAIWGAGSLNGLGWDQALPTVPVVAALGVGAALLARVLHVMEMGDDAAAALGVAVEPSRLALMIVGIATTAVVAATAGPISFIALAAPQIARRLTRAAGIAVAPAAATGAFLLLLSDVVAQRIHPDTPLPVGVVTVSVGGAYLVWLLINEARRR